MFTPADDPTIRDVFAPPPVPTAAELRQALAVLHDAVAAAGHRRPDLLPAPTAARLGRQLGPLFALVGYALHGGPPPRLG